MAKAVLLWDGDCGFCRKAVDRWLGDQPRGLEAVPWQERRELVKRLGIEDLVLKSVVLVDGDRYAARSKAVVKVLWRQRGMRRVQGALLWLVPKPLRDFGYDWVARNRHRLA